jgi:hypothetical protein
MEVTIHLLIGTNLITFISFKNIFMLSKLTTVAMKCVNKEKIRTAEENLCLHISHHLLQVQCFAQIYV